jgi:hypothetical protein
MVSRENTVILLFATTGLVLAYGGRVLTGLSDAVLLGILIFAGVVAPQLLNDYLDDCDSA